MNKINKIAIRFSDNDFYNCFTGVLETFVNAFKHKKQLPTDKNQLCLIINELSYGHYLLFQNQFEYNEEKESIINSRTKEYLQISPKNLLINEEVDDFLSKTSWDNSETHIVDFTQNEPYIFSI